jgi:hypothetical protein
MSRKLLVILLVFGLLVGNLARVPVARADQTAVLAPPGCLQMSVAGGFNLSWASCDVSLAPQLYGGGIYCGAVYMDGELMTTVATAFCTGGYPNRQYYGMSFSVTTHNDWPGDGVLHTVSWSAGYITGDGMSTDVPAGSFNVRLPADTTPWITAAAFGVPQALAVSLSGAFTTQVGVPYTCTATASDGTSPYRYLFSIDWVTVIGGVNNYTEVYTGSLTSSGTFTYTFTFTGEFLIRVTALDAIDAEASDTLDLNAGVNKPALWGQIYDIPNGDALKTYINFKLFPASVSQANPPVANGAIQTQFYEITSPGTVEKGSVYYMLSPVLITALPNPLLIYINYHDPVSGADWSYVFSFDTTGWAANSGAASNGDTWTGAETPGAFAWLWDLLVKLFRFLFVPSSTDFSAQIASGWVVITSPVPAVTPQYTIPFPNPNHLLAATGDSVDIDFGVVRNYTGYAIIKTIVQVVLDAILVFIVLSLVA